MSIITQAINGRIHWHFSLNDSLYDALQNRDNRNMPIEIITIVDAAPIAGSMKAGDVLQLGRVPAGSRIIKGPGVVGNDIVFTVETPGAAPVLSFWDQKLDDLLFYQCVRFK